MKKEDKNNKQIKNTSLKVCPHCKEPIYDFEDKFVNNTYDCDWCDGSFIIIVNKAAKYGDI